MTTTRATFATILPRCACMSAQDPFADLATAYTFANAPLLSTKSTLTKADMIKF